MKQIGAALRKRREAADHSQESFADSIDMHRNYYSAIERGEPNVTLQTLARVCRALRVKMSVVLEEAGE